MKSLPEFPLRRIDNFSSSLLIYLQLPTLTGYDISECQDNRSAELGRKASSHYESENFRGILELGQPGFPLEYPGDRIRRHSPTLMNASNPIISLLMVITHV